MDNAAATNPMPITRELPRGTWTDIALTLPRNAGLSAGQDLRSLADMIRADSEVIRADVFGRPAELDLRCPVTWVCPLDAGAGHLGGMYLQVAVGAEVTPVHLDGRRVGSLIETPDGLEFVGAGIGPADASAGAPEQARQVYERMEQALGQVGMDFSHVVRTWLYLDGIHSWYRELNAVRTAFYSERGVFDHLVPASTGVGAPSPYGWALITGLLAIKPNSERVSVQAVPSPLQCPALQYGSSFSRAVEMDMGDHRRLLISGTASIGLDGDTLHLGDIEGQVACTMEVVGAILESRDMTWEDTTRATAYVLDAQDAPVFDRYRRERGLPPMPVLTMNTAICRDDLLFELELDAVKRT